MNLKSVIFPVAAAVALVAAPSTSLADDHKVKVYRDLDGDGHYNKKTYETKNHGHSSNYYNSRPYYGSYGYRRPYAYGYGYRPYYYGYPRTSFGVSVYSSPVYRSYRSYDYSDSLSADVQSALRRRGYYHGAIDGDIGPGSRAAIRAYQRDHGLAVTGRIDAALLRSLHIS